MTTIKCCPMCGEGMLQDTNDNEVSWFWYCVDCGFSESPEIISEEWEVQANTTHHGAQYWMRMATCETLEEACKEVEGWDNSGVITEVCEGRIWSKHLRIIRTEVAVHWTHPENEKVGERKTNVLVV